VFIGCLLHVSQLRQDRKNRGNITLIIPGWLERVCWNIQSILIVQSILI
jgi:hypothetical protein